MSINAILKPVGAVLAAFLIFAGGLYLAGYKIVIVPKSGPKMGPVGQGRGTPGWRQQRGDATASEAPAGSGQGRRGGGQQGPGQQQVQRGQQPGFGPSGGILLPMQLGTASVPVVVNGKETASFIGQILVDHVEDTVIATNEGARKGWGVGKTLDYFGIKNAKGVTAFDKNGKKMSVTSKQVMDDQTFLLLTYDKSGSLLMISGPKVRGTNKGMITQEQVIQMVSGRKDLVSFPNVVRIEVKG